MRNLGGMLLLLGLGAFLYCSSRLDTAPPVPEQYTVVQALQYNTTARLEMGRFAGAGAMAIGVLMLLFPTGR